MLDFDYVGIHYRNTPDFTLDLPSGTQYYFFSLFLTDIYIATGEQKQLYPAGTVILYIPEYPQYYHHPTKGFSNDWFQLSGRELKGFLKRIELPVNTPFSVKNPELVHDYIKRIEQEFFSLDQYKEEMMDFLSKELFILLSREYKQRELYHEVLALEPQFRQIKYEILSHMEKRWTLKDMAALAGLSPSRFSHIYTSLFHISPKKNLLLERMNKARFLIASQNYSITEAAQCVGYDDIYHFSKQFKKVMGEAPSYFKNINAGY